MESPEIPPSLPTLAPTGGWLRALAVSADERWLAAAGEDRCVYLWSTDSWELFKLGNHDSWVLSLAFLPDNRHLLSCSFDHKLAVWDVAAREQVLQRRFSAPLTALKVADAQTVWVGDESGKLYRLLFPSLQEVHSLQLCPSAIADLDVSPDGLILACASGEDKITLWDLQENRLWEKLKGHQGAVRSLCFERIASSSALADTPCSPRTLFSGGADRAVYRWMWKDGQRAEIGHHKGTVWQVRHAPGRGVLTAGGDKSVCLWQIDGSRQRVLGQHGGEVRALAFSASWVASAGQDCQVRLWPWP